MGSIDHIYNDIRFLRLVRVSLLFVQYITSNKKFFVKTGLPQKGQKQGVYLQSNALTSLSTLLHFAVQLHKVD